MRKVYSPHHNAYIPIGGRLVPHVHPKLRLRDYIKSDAGPSIVAPDSLSYADIAKASLARMYCNDKYGCCVVAALAHARGVTSANAGAEVQFADPDILTMYNWFSGGTFNQSDPSTDQGCDEGTALSVASSRGFTDGVKLSGFIGIDGTNWEEVKIAVFLFECLMSGQGLPESWITPFPMPGTILDVGTPVPTNGHAMAHPGYTADGKLQTATWGMSDIWETKEAVAKVASPAGGGELWAFLSPDIISRASQKAPNGFDAATLLVDLQALQSPS